VAADPEQIVCTAGATVTLGVGLTKIDAVIDVPGHPLAEYVIVNVTVTGVVAVLVRVPEIFPEPEAAMPVTLVVLSLVQL
jgi:hypothetical protein